MYPGEGRPEAIFFFFFSPLGGCVVAAAGDVDVCGDDLSELRGAWTRPFLVGVGGVVGLCTGRRCGVCGRAGARIIFL